MRGEQIGLLAMSGTDQHVTDAARHVLRAAEEIAGAGGFARVREIVLKDGREGLCKSLLTGHRPAEASLLFGGAGADVYAALVSRVEA